MVLRRISALEQHERRVTIRSCLASQRIEGLKPDTEAVKDCEKWVSGEKTIDEIVEIFKAQLRIVQAITKRSGGDAC